MGRPYLNYPLFPLAAPTNFFENRKPDYGWEKQGTAVGILAWDRMLQQKAGDKEPCFVLLGGSDAHGSFNYSEGWETNFLSDFDPFGSNDNCIGKVRTLLYLPERKERKAPDVEEIEAVIRQGSCVVTDGPVLNFTLGFNGKKARIGEVLEISGDGELEIVVDVASTPEFGKVHQVDVCYFFQSLDDGKLETSNSITRSETFKTGTSKNLLNSLPNGDGYIRLATQTKAPNYLQLSDEEDDFYCITNPIWIKQTDESGTRALVLNCRDEIMS